MITGLQIATPSLSAEKQKKKKQKKKELKCIMKEAMKTKQKTMVILLLFLTQQVADLGKTNVQYLITYK
jgi:hypothetical protein